jgi:hypothetical protein
MDALQHFPDFDIKLITEKGDAVCQKQDIFKGLMWFAYTNNFANWHVLKVEQVNEIIAENKQKKKVSSLEDYVLEVTEEPEKDFNNAVGQESLTRFDQPKKKKRPKKRKQAATADSPATEKPVTENKNPNANPNKNNNRNNQKNRPQKPANDKKPENKNNNNNRPKNEPKK